MYDQPAIKPAGYTRDSAVNFLAMAQERLYGHQEALQRADAEQAALSKGRDFAGDSEAIKDVDGRIKALSHLMRELRQSYIPMTRAAVQALQQEVREFDRAKARANAVQAAVEPVRQAQEATAEYTEEF